MIISEENTVCLVNAMLEALFKAGKELIKAYPDGKNEGFAAVQDVLLSVMLKDFLYTYKKNSPTKIIAIRWQADDVKMQAKDRFNLDLTDEQAGKVLDMLKRTHDASIGINWEVITYAIEHTQ